MSGSAFDPAAAGWIPANPAPATQSGQPAADDSFATGPTPGFAATVAAATDQQKAMTARAQGFATDMYPLLKAQQELAIAPTGPNSPSTYAVSAALRSASPEWLQNVLHYATPSLVGGQIMTPEQTDAYGLLKKLLTQGQLGVPGAARSNEGTETAGAAFPNVEMPPPAAKAALQGIIGLRRMEQDQTMQWQQSGLPAQALPTFISKFQTNADPRVYTWDQTPQAQQAKILNSLAPGPGGPREQFIRKVQQADSNGIYNTFGMSPPQ